ncbi:MAG: sigma-54-dependent Fis family transcriptional regulator [Treponema sp.]|nr:sigma-54-dependent Fis family transcriptional regulator [Candidatus Treponema caballi]
MLEAVQKVKKFLVFTGDNTWKSCFQSLDKQDFSILILQQSESPLADVLQYRPDVICFSYSFFVKTGLSFFINLIRIAEGVPVILLSESDDLTITEWILENGGHVISGKPDPSYVSYRIGRCIEKAPVRAEKAPEMIDLRPFDTFIGETEEMRSLKLMAARFARSNLPILITGETGTGKTVFARCIHDVSLRACRPFIPGTMPEIQESIAENILFGAVKGAFTNAETHPGLFEAADGGTLFLDEITESSPGLQAKLLRVLGSGVIQRVGGNRQIPVDVRFIAATNRELPAEVAAGRFRKDLYYRIAPITLVIPPLRERLEDIPLLAAHFLKDTGKSLSRGAFGKLLSHTWPGNVRELVGCIERSVVMSVGKTITEEDISFMPSVTQCLPLSF